MTPQRVQTQQREFYLGDNGLDPIYAALHTPTDSQVRGAVLIFGSLAKEQMDAVRGLRLLADQLASRRIAAMRFDYLGVGDSADEQVRSDSVTRWRSSIDRAITFLCELDVPCITGIGLRAGTLLLDDALDRNDAITSAVYWDPVGRGRAFIREQQSLYRLSVGADDELNGDVVALVGATLSAAAAKEFSAFELGGKSGEQLRSCLVAARPTTTDKRVSALTHTHGVDHIEVEGMGEFVQAPSFLVSIPITAINAITAWVDAHTDAATVAINPSYRTSATIDVNGVDVVERIDHIGSRGMFAIRTYPAGVSDPQSLRSVLFFSTANDLHTGPNREWVDLARSVAAAGGQAVRFDRSGAGESGEATGTITAIYADQSADEAVEATRAIATQPTQVLTTGVCSGSWYAAYAAKELKVSATVLINVVAWSWRHKRATTGQAEPDDFGTPRSDPEWQKTPRARIKKFLSQNLPYSVWKMLGHRGITQVPEVLLRPLFAAKVDTTLVLAPNDMAWYRDQRGPEGAQRLSRRLGTAGIIETEMGDHPAYHQNVRDALRQPILDWVQD